MRQQPLGNRTAGQTPLLHRGDQHPSRPSRHLHQQQELLAGQGESSTEAPSWSWSSSWSSSSSCPLPLQQPPSRWWSCLSGHCDSERRSQRCRKWEFLRQPARTQQRQKHSLHHQRQHQPRSALQACWQQLEMTEWPPCASRGRALGRGRLAEVVEEELHQQQRQQRQKQLRHHRWSATAAQQCWQRPAAARLAQAVLPQAAEQRCRSASC